MAKVSAEINTGTGEVTICKCGFGCRKTFEGQKDFDTDYIDYTIKQVVKVTGKDENGDDVGVNVDKVIITKRPIRETIMADAQNVGVDAYMRPFILAGEVPKVSFDKEAEVKDFTKLPDNLADGLDLQARAQIMFRMLPEDLKGSAVTMDDFFKGMSKDKFDKYIEKHSKKADVKDEKPKEDK